MNNSLIRQRTIQKLFDKGNSTLFIWNNDEHWSINYVSKNVSKILGYSDKEFLKNKITYFQCIHKDFVAQVQEEVDSFSKTNKDFFEHKPYKIITKDKEERWVLDQTVVDRDENGEITFYVGYINDITNLMNLNQSNQRLEKRVEKVLKSTNDGIWEWNPKTDVAFFSKQWKDMLGYEEDELEDTGETFFNLIHPEDKYKAQEALAKHFEDENNPYAVELRLKNKDGSYKWILSRGKAYTDDNKSIHMLGSHIDISHKKDIEEKLKESEFRWKFALEGSGDGVWDWNIQTNEVFYSKQWKEMLGYEEDEIGNSIHTWSDTIRPSQLERVHKYAQDYLDGKIDKYLNEYQVVCKDGSFKWILDRGIVVSRDKDGKAIRMIGTHTDIDKSKKLQTQLQQAQKIANLGIWEFNLVSEELDWSDEIFNIFEVDKNKVKSSYEIFQSRVHPEDREIVAKEYDKSLNTRQPYDITHRLLMPDGRIKYVREQCDTNFDLEGKPLISYGTVQDITELTSLDLKVTQERNRYKNLMELSADGILIINQKFELVEFSQVAKKMFGYSDEEMLKLKILDWDMTLNEESLKNLVASFSKNPVVFETVLKRKDASTYDALITSVIIKIDGEEFIYASVRDITKENKLKNQLLYERNFVSAIIDNANAIVSVIDSNGRMVKLNSYAQNFTGYTEDEISSEAYKWKCLLPPEDHDNVVNIIKNAKEGKIAKSYQNSWISKYGEKKLFEWSNTLVKKEDGSMDYVATIGIDITEREEHKKVFETIFNTSKDGLAILDLSSKFLEFNKAYLDMTGFTREELLTKTCINMTIPQDKQKISDALKEVFNNGHLENFEKTCIVKDNRLVTIDMSIALMPDKKSLLISTKDVTQRKAEQDELQRTKDLAEKASRSKSEFLANMSHEIRTPLNGMIGLTKLTLNTNLDEIQKDYLEKSLSSSKVLLSIINDILDYSKIEANRVDIVNETFCLSSIMDSLSDMFSFQVFEKNLDFIFTIDPNIPRELIADEVRIMQVLTNLIGNSIKFTKNGHINLHLNLLDRDEETVTIECQVQDTGMGISQEKQRKLFQPFEQGDSSTTKEFGGTGLGLMISKRLIELMGGEIWLKSEEAKGTTFGFKLKLGYLKDSLIKVDKISKFNNNTFLFVDDSEIERDYMSNILTSWGIKLKTAENGEEAFKIIKNESFDYLVLDWKMPKLDGLELLAKLKYENIEVSNILMVTAHNKSKLLSKAQKDGIVVNKVLQKPYTPSKLYETLFGEKYQIQKTKQSENKKFRLCETKEALLVEDNLTNQLVASKIFENIGFNVDIANNGQEALQKAKEKKYDIIFMDIHMPIMDGFTSSMKIREFDTKTPIIALSAAVMQEDKKLSAKAKMNNHLSKPIEFKEVKNILDKYFKLEYYKTKDTDKELSSVEVDGIDIYTFQKELQLDINTIYAYYNTFRKNYENELNDALKYDVPSDAMKNFIHKLKGTSGNLRINFLYQLCEQIEHDTENKMLYNELFFKLNKVLKEIKNKITPLVENNSNLLTKHDMKKLLEKVIKAFENYDLVEDTDIEKIITTLQKFLEETQIQELKKYFIENETEKLSKLLMTIKRENYEA